MNHHDYSSLVASLNHAVDLLNRHRTPDPRFIAAYDTLKQARAMIEKTVGANAPVSTPLEFELAA